MAKAYRSNKYGGLYSDTFNTPIGRVFWLHLANPKEYKGPIQEGQAAPQPKYEATICFPKDHPKATSLLQKLSGEVAEMIRQFNQGKKTKLGECELFQDGDEDQELQTKYPWLAGCFYMTARSRFQPAAVDRSGDEYPISDLQGGMKARVAFQACVSNGGVSYTLEGVQFIEDDGQRFGGGGKKGSALFESCDDVEEAEVEEAEDDAEEEVSEVEASVEAVPPTPSKAPAVSTPPKAKAQKGKAALVNML